MLRSHDYNTDRFRRNLVEVIKNRVKVREDAAFKLVEIVVKDFSKHIFYLEWNELKDFFEYFRRFVDDNIFNIAYLIVEEFNAKVIEEFLRRMWKNTSILEIFEKSRALRNEVISYIERILKQLRDSINSAEINLSKRQLLLVLRILEIDPRNLTSHIKELRGIPVITDKTIGVAITSLENAKKIMVKFSNVRRIMLKNKELSKIISVYPRLRVLLSKSTTYVTAENILFIYNYEYGLAVITTINKENI